MVVTFPSEGPISNQAPIWSVVVVGCCDVDGGGGCVVCGVFCLVGGVLCGSGSSSDDEVEEECEEESDESSGVDLSGGRSPSGSSRTRVLVSGLWAPEDVPGCRDVELSDTSIGGGSSTCICVAVLSSAAVGTAPRSTYLDPVKSF